MIIIIILVSRVQGGPSGRGTLLVDMKGKFCSIINFLYTVGRPPSRDVMFCFIFEASIFNLSVVFCTVAAVSLY